MDRQDSDTAPAPGSGLAISALVLGIVGLVLLPLAVVALALGIIALTKGQSKRLAIPGVVLGGLEILFIAVIAIPGLLENRVAAYEAAALASLKTAVFPSQVQFQEGKHVDEDKNGVGEKGFIPEMSGAEKIHGQEGIRLSFLSKIWDSNEPLVNGYRFALYLPDGASAASSRAGITDHSPAAITARENQWIAYAWPEPWGQSGRRAFAILPNGTLLSTQPSATGTKPAWNAALSKGWGSQPPAEWTPHRR